MDAVAADRLAIELDLRYRHAKYKERLAARAVSRLNPYQVRPEGDWSIWPIIAGRGAGKTYAGSEFILDEVAAGAHRIALVGSTTADVRDVMVEGPSGIIARAIARGWKRPFYQASRRRVLIYSPDNRPALAFIYSAEEPDRLRGPEHEAGWSDEIAAWDRNRAQEAWDNLQFGMRIGRYPRTIVTTTPKPVPLVKELMKRGADEEDTAVALTRGRTVDNAANLSPAALAEYKRRYAGTRIGRQELEGELLEDVEGALWKLTTIDLHRMSELPDGVTLRVVAIGVDPAVTSNESSDETGIVCVAAGSDRRGYVLDDQSLIGAPFEWARAAISAYTNNEANFIVVEVNNGGEMVTQTIRTIDALVPIRPVRASRGKATRAEPISSLYEQGWITHLGSFPKLEDQMTSFVPGLSQKSPDRMDALVWGFTAIQRYIGEQSIGGVI